MLKTKYDYLRSLLNKSLNELLELEKAEVLELSFSPGICVLMQHHGTAPFLKAVKDYEIEVSTDPFHDHSAGMFTYADKTIFFKITHLKKAAEIEFGLYDEINAIRRLRSEFQWFALEAVIDF